MLYFHLPAVLSVVGSIQVLERGSGGKFKVICTYTGGRPLRMSVTGPSGDVENMDIVPVEIEEWVGSDTFTAEVVRQDGTHGDQYVCMASNEVSNSSDSVLLKG